MKASKLIRDKSTPERRAFWDSIKKTAEEIKDWPAWKRAGININPDNFRTYEPEEDKKR
jgi:hypothetical protein